MSQVLPIPHALANESNYLYTTAHNYMDFSVDDNGLWVIYGLPGTNNTAIVKVMYGQIRIFGHYVIGRGSFPNMICLPPFNFTG